MQLSKRLSAVSEMVTSHSRLADIGTDHGYIPIHLVLNERIPQALAMDINQGPLNRAQENIENHKLNTYIETRLSDGVSALKEGEADSVVIAGMGGGLVIKILTEGRTVLQSVREFILSPQSELCKVRHFLEENHYLIQEETMVVDEGKYYTVMRVVHGDMHYEKEIDYKYGRLLIQKKNEVLLSFLQKELSGYEKVRSELMKNIGEKAIQRQIEIDHELECIRETIGVITNR